MGQAAKKPPTKNFVERYIVLNNKKVMSVGFTEVASDDAKTLLDQTVFLS